MGAETQNQRLAGDATRRAQALEGVQRRRAAIRTRGAAPAPSEERRPVGEEETGMAPMFPNQVPGASFGQQVPPGFEEAAFRRSEITRERDRTGRREELFNQFQQAAAQRGGEQTERIAPGGAVERGAGIFGAPFGGAGTGGPTSGIAFGPGRANRMPERGTPDYARMIERMRGLGRR